MKQKQKQKISEPPRQSRGLVKHTLLGLIVFLGLACLFYGSFLTPRSPRLADEEGSTVDPFLGGSSSSFVDDDNNNKFHGHQQLDSPVPKSFPVCDLTYSELIPCLDRNLLYQLRVRPKLSLMEHYERHCPLQHRRYNCLIPPPIGYKIPIKWPASRDEVWKANIPHTHLAQEKSDQHWMVVNGEKINFPGGGTHFHDGADKYIVSLARVALKTLIVIHRALREVDPTFHEELINYGRSRSHMLNMSHFRDDSSASAWDYSAWIRAYALFLEERLESFRVLKSDVETDRPRTKELDTIDLLEQLPALQQLLYRVLGCQPEGAAVHNHVIQIALSMVALESVKIYNAISDGTVNLVDKFFEMQRNDSIKALDIYRRAGQQAERLSEFYEVCKNLDIGRGEKFIKIEQPPASFLQAMEEYVRDAPRGSTFRTEQVKQVVDERPTVVLAIEDKEITDMEEERPPSLPSPDPVKEEKPVTEAPDLLGLNEPNPVALDLDEKNALALAIVPVDNPPATTLGPNLENGATGWELALVTAPSSNETATAGKLAGGLDKLTLDSLYDDAIRRTNQTASYNPWEAPPPLANPMMNQPVHDPFFASNSIVAPPSVQMAAMANQQQAFMYQQQQQQMMSMGSQQQQPSMNPFGNPHGHGMPVQTYNPYSGLL